MKKSVKYALLAVLLVAVLALAVAGYNYLSPRYTPQQTTAQNDDTDNAEQAGDSMLSGGEQEPAATGETQTAADFTVLDMDGNEVKLSDFFGKPIVINFWATWCPPCRSELPAFNQQYEDNKQDIVFLMVNLTDGNRDKVEGVKEFVADEGYTFPVYFDTQYSASNAYGVSSIPQTVIIDKNGEMVSSQIGAMDEATLERLVNDLQ